MSNEVRVPELGESVVSAVIASWLKHEGDSVKAGEALVELETDKVNVEVSAEEDGVLQTIIKKEGDDVKVGDVLALVSAASDADGQLTTKQVTAQVTARLRGRLHPASAERTVPISPDWRKRSRLTITLISRRSGAAHDRVVVADVTSYLTNTAQPTARTQPTTASMVNAPSPQVNTAPAVT